VCVCGVCVCGVCVCVCVWRVECVDVEAGGTYSNHRALRCCWLLSA
jgi:hypothetical protein